MGVLQLHVPQLAAEGSGVADLLSYRVPAVPQAVALQWDTSVGGPLSWS